MVNVVELSEECRNELMHVAEVAPEFQFDSDGALAGGFVESARELMSDGTTALRPVVDRLRYDLKTSLGRAGYTVVADLVNPSGEEAQEIRKATALCALLGTPFRMVERMGFWQHLGVNLNAMPYRFSGIGYNPLHIDGVNTAMPPDYVVLVSFRKDPAGGGATIVADLQSAVGRLSEVECQHLRMPVFREGQYYGVTGVGPELNPFAVIEPLAIGLSRVRVTGKMLPDMEPGPDKEMLSRFVAELQRDQEVFMLEPGQAVIINQVLRAHGRLALGPGQENIDASRRRELRQCYIHADLRWESSDR